METTIINYSPGNLENLADVSMIPGTLFGIGGTLVLILFLVAMFWSIVWKGIALWKSARNGHKGWYVAILILNTLGILEIIYLIFFNKKKAKKEIPENNIPEQKELNI
ncbi:MAG TPA: DUF5652 family protein [Candidatus Paceibacterota bacterium]|jgi:hypothetical protein|nr:DUF5652 family protein [Candidatus Paceibacterota bacterium]HQB56971.1 DUF5652 family protein [Candidatus Paceibacterota bacterium]